MRGKAPISKILKVALHLFSSKGYAETKMTDIARETGISVGALYLRFNSKEDLCMALINDQTKGYEKLAKRVTGADKEPLQALRDYISFCLEYAFKRKQLISMLYREHRLSFLQPMRKTFFKTQHRLIEGILISGIKKGAIRPLDTNDTALMIFASIRGAVMLRLIFGVGSSRGLGESLYDLVSNGIRKDAS